jgi:myo-inositol-1(or 4)-monophosphatase
MTDFLRTAIKIAHESGAVLAELFARGASARAKGAFDVVTEADEVAERIVLDRLRLAFPSHGVVAEESGGYRGSSSTHRWHVDPLDGTKNFARGYPAFSLSLALECEGDLVVGVVFDPIRRELFAAERGSGAWCNDQRMHVSSIERLEQCLVTTGFPSAARHRHGDIPPLHHVAMRTQGVRRTGSSALDLSYVACGRLDAFWDVGLRSWDVAAGLVLTSEAGGRYSDLRGRSFDFDSPDLLAANPRVHGLFAQVFSDVLAAPPMNATGPRA